MTHHHETAEQLVREQLVSQPGAVQEVGSIALTGELGATVPTGFVRAEMLPKPVVLDGKQFDGRVSALDKVSYTVNTTELTTDGGQVVRLCDLRPELARNLKKVAPRSKADQERADAAFFRDLKNYVDGSTAQKTVTSLQRVHYSSVGGTKIRSYWLPVAAEGNDKVPMIARIGDCGNASQQVQLYRQLFNLKMS